MTQPTELLGRIGHHHKLLLIAALSTTDSAKEAWGTWRTSVNFEDVDWPSARLLPMLALRPDVVEDDDPLQGRIRGLYRKSWVSNEGLIATTLPARSALVAVGVPILHVEALTFTNLLADHGTRPFSDVDFCVPRRSMRTTIDVLESLGWRQQKQKFRARWRHHPHHFTQGNARIRVIERIPWPAASPSAWEFAIAEDSGEYVLNQNDAIVHAAVRATQSWQPLPMQWVADITLLTSTLGYKRVGDARKDEHISERATAHQSEDVVHAALGAADRLIGEIR